MNGLNVQDAVKAPTPIIALERESLHFVIYHSVMEIEAEEWRQLNDPGKDLAMDQRLIHLMEKTLSDQARFWTVAVRNRVGRLVACACLSLFQTDMMQSSPPFLQKIVEKLRHRRPNFLKMKVLFCGLPLPSGCSHYRLLPVLESRPILILLNQAMRTIAKQEGASMIVFKEFDSERCQTVNALQKMGFYRGMLEPVYEIKRSFKNFDAYLSAVRATYRRQIQANIKKFNDFNFCVMHITDPAEIHQQFTDEVYQLYLNVWNRAKEKLECFSIEFFRGLARALPEQTILTLITHDEKPIAFAISLLDEEAYCNIYIGLDYAYVEKADLYFNLFYQELEIAFHFQKKKILLGQTSGQFKARIGAVADPRFFFVYPINPLLQFMFKFFRTFIFPKIAKSGEKQVFKVQMIPSPLQGEG